MEDNFTNDFGNFQPVDSNELLPNNDFGDDFMNSLSAHSTHPQDLNQSHSQQMHSNNHSQAPPRQQQQQQPHDQQHLLHQHSFGPNSNAANSFDNSPQSFAQTPLGFDQPFNQQGLHHQYTDLENLPMSTPGISPSQKHQMPPQPRHNNLAEPTNKRTRASGEVLALLVSEFNKNPNPSGPTRKKLSDQTGMPERSVRIWFQNRRAKSRKMEKAQADHGDFGAADGQGGMNGAAIFNTRYDNIPTTLNQNYYFIDVKTLTVGSWKRIKSGHLSHDNLLNVKNLSNLSPASINEIMHNSTDLMILISKKNNEINYFFSAITEDSKILFRIFYPISSINNCSITTVQENDESDSPDSDNSPNNGNNQSASIPSCDLKLYLNKPPKFAVAFAHMISADNNQWSICDDFSEGHQVNDAFIGGGTGIPHVFSGALNSLRFMNSHILDYKSTNSNTEAQEFNLPSRADNISPIQNPQIPHNQFINHHHDHHQQQQQQPFNQQILHQLPALEQHFNPDAFGESSTPPSSNINGQNHSLPLNEKNLHENSINNQQMDNLIKSEGHEAFDAFIHQDYGSTPMDLGATSLHNHHHHHQNY